jgi:IS4 transposase
MWMAEVFERFVQHSPFSVMTRATLEHLFSDSFLDQVFADYAQVQYQKELAFSTVTSLLTQVVLRYRPSLRSAYARSEGVPATLKSVYEKLQHVEPVVCQALVEQTAHRAQQVLDNWPQARRPDPVEGLRLRILDGNYLAGTQHRLAPLRGDGAAALPGMSVVMRDDRSGLLVRLVCREDAYTNERALLDDLLGWVQADDLIVADRNFCWFEFISRLAKQAFFVVRHHSQLELTEQTPLQWVGRSESGEVYEQEVEVGPPDQRRRLRLVVIQLFEPTQEGDTEIRLLSNVPKDKADALRLAEVYLRRWTVEHSFQELTEQLRCEVNTLGYPKAALFGFSLAVCAYNLLVVLKGALATVHGQAKVEQELSTYAMAQEISQDTSGLNIALPAEFWQRFGQMSSVALAAWLESLARRLPWQPYKKSKHKAQKRTPRKKKMSRRRPHLSTARVLQKGRKKSQ